MATIALLGAGCAPAAVELRGASKTRADDLSRCATRQLERLGYSVRDGKPESGVVRATRNTSTTRMVLHSGNDSEDRIVVTTVSGGADGRSTMSVAGESLFWGADARRIADRPSQEVARQASEILEACGILDAVRVESP
jgi:hypothetical protein